MFTKKFDKEFYLLTYNWEYAKDLSEVLKDRDYILYRVKNYVKVFILKY